MPKSPKTKPGKKMGNGPAAVQLCGGSPASSSGNGCTSTPLASKKGAKPNFDLSIIPGASAGPIRAMPNFERLLEVEEDVLESSVHDTPPPSPDESADEDQDQTTSGDSHFVTATPFMVTEQLSQFGSQDTSESKALEGLRLLNGLIAKGKISDRVLGVVEWPANTLPSVKIGVTWMLAHETMPGGLRGGLFENCNKDLYQMIVILCYQSKRIRELRASTNTGADASVIDGLVSSHSTLVVFNTDESDHVKDLAKEFRGLLVYTYLASSADKSPENLAVFDIICTTHNTIRRESNCPLLKIKWDRVIAGPGHGLWRPTHLIAPNKEVQPLRKITADYRYATAGILSQSNDLLGLAQYLNLEPMVKEDVGDRSTSPPNLWTEVKRMKLDNIKKNLLLYTGA